jgi:hypothetical protein
MMQIWLVIASSIIKVIRNTHRHPINLILHGFGAIFYIAGLYMITYHFIIDTTMNLPAGIFLWVSAIAIFITGHKIEGNISAMTPVVIIRLISRKISHYFFTHSIHRTRA